MTAPYTSKRQSRHQAQVRGPRAANDDLFVPLDQEKRLTVSTRVAAIHLDRAIHTLHVWACDESGPIRPLRVHRRLAWRVADIKKLLGVA